MHAVIFEDRVLPSQIALCDLLGLRVADLGVWLDARGSGIRLAMDACHAKFPGRVRREDDLMLRVREGSPRVTDGWRTIFCDPGTWQLWRDGDGRYVFAGPRGSPPTRRLAVNAAFTAGELIGEFGASGAAEEAVYPLQSMDAVLYVNWLAAYGDLVLHASGVGIDRRGYAFAGPAGVGKSTVAASLMCASSEAAEAATTNGATTAEAVTTSTGGAVVLGEDSVILRWLDGRFWIYGTPWHEDPAMCAPDGVPLEKLFFLERNSDSGVRPLAAADGIARLLQTAFVPYYRRDAVARILDNLASLAEGVPFYTLSFRIGADVMRLIGEA